MTPLGKHSSHSLASPPSFTHLDHRAVNALQCTTMLDRSVDGPWAPVDHSCLFGLYPSINGPFSFPAPDKLLHLLFRP